MYHTTFGDCWAFVAGLASNPHPIQPTGVNSTETDEESKPVQSDREAESSPAQSDREEQDKPSEQSSSEDEKHPSIVSWSTPTDPDNPRDWSLPRKIAVTTMLNVYTFVVYAGSSIYVPSEEGVVARFRVTETEAALGLALYVFAYGFGALLLSPLSEIPAIGRNPPYIISFGLFVILCIPTALADNLPGFLFLRFLLGFLGSPVLATTGASLGDIWDTRPFFYVIPIWTASATVGPAVAPTIAAFAIERLGWRFSSWETLLASGPVCLVIFFFLPETSHANILLRRARRLRAETENHHLRSDSENEQAQMRPRQILYVALIKPWQINALDPAILFSTLYTGLLYAIFYTYLESNALVFPPIYGFGPGATALVLLSVFPSTILGLMLLFAYYHYRFLPKLESNESIQEDVLFPALFGSLVVPVGMFLYAWTSRASVHWMAPVVGLSLAQGATFVVFNSVFSYVPLSYPKYAASLFAANDFARAALSFAAILVARPMFEGIGINGGVSLLAGLAIVCIGGIYALYFFGSRLRARSRFAVSS